MKSPDQYYLCQVGKNKSIAIFQASPPQDSSVFTSTLNFTNHQPVDREVRRLLEQSVRLARRLGDDNQYMLFMQNFREDGYAYFRRYAIEGLVDANNETGFTVAIGYEQFLKYVYKFDKAQWFVTNVGDDSSAKSTLYPCISERVPPQLQKFVAKIPVKPKPMDVFRVAVELPMAALPFVAKILYSYFHPTLQGEEAIASVGAQYQALFAQSELANVSGITTLHVQKPSIVVIQYSPVLQQVTVNAVPDGGEGLTLQVLANGTAISFMPRNGSYYAFVKGQQNITAYDLLHHPLDLQTTHYDFVASPTAFNLVTQLFMMAISLVGISLLLYGLRMLELLFFRRSSMTLWGRSRYAINIALCLVSGAAIIASLVNGPTYDASLMVENASNQVVTMTQFVQQQMQLSVLMQKNSLQMVCLGALSLFGGSIARCIAPYHQGVHSVSRFAAAFTVGCLVAMFLELVQKNIWMSLVVLSMLGAIGGTGVMLMAIFCLSDGLVVQRPRFNSNKAAAQVDASLAKLAQKSQVAFFNSQGVWYFSSVGGDAHNASQPIWRNVSVSNYVPDTPRQDFTPDDNDEADSDHWFDSSSSGTVTPAGSVVEGATSASNPETCFQVLKSLFRC